MPNQVTSFPDAFALIAANLEGGPASRPAQVARKERLGREPGEESATPRVSARDDGPELGILDHPLQIVTLGASMAAAIGLFLRRTHPLPVGAPVAPALEHT